jgi:uncharacterized protein (TIGR03067 family)
MRLLLSIAAIINMAVGVVPAGDNESDVGSLQGTWKVLPVISGNKEKDAALSRCLLEVKRNKYLWHNGTLPEAGGKFKLRPDLKPKQIDLYGDNAENPDLPRLGIYKLENDRLTMCWECFPFMPVRPSEFKVDEPNERTLVVLQRMKK